VTSPTGFAGGSYAQAGARNGVPGQVPTPLAGAPPVRKPRQNRSRVTRSRLLEAAVSCLADLGYPASTVGVVAERAGVSRGALQHHFPTREALFTAAVENLARQRADEVAAELGPLHAGDTDRIIGVIFTIFTGQLFRAALALWVAAVHEPALHAQVAALEGRMGRSMHRLVVDVLGVDESQPGVRETIQATLDLARGLGLASLLSDDSARRAGIARQWAVLLQAGLSPSPLK